MLLQEHLLKLTIFFFIDRVPQQLFSVFIVHMKYVNFRRPMTFVGKDILLLLYFFLWNWFGNLWNLALIFLDL